MGKITGSILLFCVGMTVNYEEIDYDYSFYLGKDYKKTQKLPPHPPSAIIGTGHSSFFDNLTVMAKFGCSFVAKESIKKYPVFGLGCIG